MDNKKLEYIKPEMVIEKFEMSDVICASADVKALSINNHQMAEVTMDTWGCI